MADLVDDVFDIIAEKARVDRGLLDLSANLSDLNIASLDVVEIIFALEEKFDIEIPYNANETEAEFSTVGDVVNAVKALVAEKV